MDTSLTTNVLIVGAMIVRIITLALAAYFGLLAWKAIPSSTEIDDHIEASGAGMKLKIKRHGRAALFIMVSIGCIIFALRPMNLKRVITDDTRLPDGTVTTRRIDETLAAAAKPIETPVRAAVPAKSVPAGKG